MPDLQALRQAVQESPESVPLRLLLAQGLVEEMALEEAMSCYRLLLDQNPDQREARLGIAHILYLNGRVSEAAVRIEGLIAEFPRESGGARLFLSRLLLAEGDRDGARVQYERAVEANRTNIDIAFERELGLRGRISVDQNDPGVQLPNPPSEVPGDSPIEGQGTEPPVQGFDFDESMGPVEEGDGMPSFESDEDVLPEPLPATAKFSDVGGLADVKETLRKRWISPLKNPELAKAYGVNGAGGLLLYGPPGCGKSLLAEAVAGESGCRIMRVGIHDILDPYFGSSERNLFQLFDAARADAPVVLLIDHVDTIAGDRQRLRDSQARNLANQFLHQLQLLTDSGEPVLVIGCTDTPWHLDRAFLRPGRFGQPVFVPPPTRTERSEILRIHGATRPIGEVDYDELARSTRSFSGADLSAVFDLASSQALDAATRTGEFQPLDNEALMRARQAIHPSTTAWFRIAQKNIPRAQDDEVFAPVREAVTNNRRA